MGQANRPPKSRYTRKLTISEHAVMRFRERVDEEFKARPDEDLANLLDERIDVSNDRQDIRDKQVGADAPSATIVKIEDRVGKISYAVIRDKTVVTVLSAGMAEDNFATGKWERPLNNPFSKLKDVKPWSPAVPSAGIAPEDRPLSIIQGVTMPRLSDVNPNAAPPKRSRVEFLALELGRLKIELSRAQLAEKRLMREVMEIVREVMEIESQLDQACVDEASEEPATP